MVEPIPVSEVRRDPLAANRAPDTSAADKKRDRKPLRDRSPVLAHLRSVLLTGLLTAIPLFITLYIIQIIYGLVTTFTQGPAVWIVDHMFNMHESILLKNLETFFTATFAVLLSLIIVYAIGLLGTFFIGRQILAQVEHFISNLPLIKGIYGTSKQVISVFRQGGGGGGFQRVVLVQFPREGTWTLAFVTNTIHDSAPPPLPGAEIKKLVCCFIPMTPNPTSGFFQMFPEDQVRNTDWTVDMGIKIVLSGGLLAPHDLAYPDAPEPPAVPAKT